MTAVAATTSALPLELDLRLRSRRPVKLADDTLRWALDAPMPIAPAIRDPRVSIAVVTHGNLAFTKLCIASVLHNSDVPMDMIVVDNASRDATPDYLRELAEANAQVRAILNDSNRGFAAANNQALAAARGEYLVLLNNDTIVPPGWLSRLVAHLESDATVGLLGPVTNRIGNEAEIETAYETYGQMLDFAAKRASVFARRTSDLPRPAMFCVAMTRNTFAKLGPLDEQFQVGLFEDDDYAMRARAAGLRCACAEDIFVHHFGEASFGDLFANGERQALFEANRARFEKKWQTKWQPMSRRASPAGESLNARIAAAARDGLPRGAAVAIVSKGDEALLEQLRKIGLTPSHFPASTDGGNWAGHHPANSTAVRAELSRTSADFLLVPHASAWWCECYRDFFATLGQPIVSLEGVCTIYRVQNP